MIELSSEQIQELRKLQKLTVEENPDLEITLNEICYINNTNEQPWGDNITLKNYVELISDFNSYNKYLALLKEYNIET